MIRLLLEVSGANNAQVEQRTGEQVGAYLGLPPDQLPPHTVEAHVRPEVVADDGTVVRWTADVQVVIR